MFETLSKTPRLLLEQDLKPIQGERFQPTGFADLGAALYETASGQRRLLVESAQSVANRMEAACLEAGGPEILDDLQGLPYVRVKLRGPVETVTTSLAEAHRINSPYIVTQETFQKPFLEATGYAKGRPIDWAKVARTIVYYDPSSIIHGVFMANLLDGRMRLARALSGFIEAQDVREAASGGVKNNALDPKGEIRAKNYDKNVYGNVPYQRMEYTASSITAYFNVDLALIRSYRLPDAATQLLLSLALFKVRRFLNQGLRLRTACDLGVAGDLRCSSEYVVPSERDLLVAVKNAIGDCALLKLFAEPSVTELVTECVLKASDDKDKPATEALSVD
ncbi:MAG: type I-U CRISPR-associated protein Cas7 [Bryobacteraceae bacterium]|nr:type I-U CRISPR-associated protein Cas7 [Bryobacteraceae bacterium]